ncbi:DNA-binding protein [Staphylococcus sp. Marseille-Q5304]|uniref:DNA-binding protein n=1 Tax=Staphylococcus sp. Marseille-Q5304 TaxID=2942200 RepID=UPI002073D4A2|nr:DNA-binding protein [Staphylococcus sp. Marseille-Q5304]
MTTALPNIGKPAKNALDNLGVTTLEEVAEYERLALLDTHGVGPKAIERLQTALKEIGLNFKHEAITNLPFEFEGDLNCDNAPKRRRMIDFIIGTATIDDALLKKIADDNMVWEIAGYNQETYSLEDFISELNEHKTAITSIEVKHNISHGKMGSVDGKQITKDGTITHFADFFEFESHKKDAKIKKVTSYVIMEEEDD